MLEKLAHDSEGWVDERLKPQSHVQYTRGTFATALLSLLEVAWFGYFNAIQHYDVRTCECRLQFHSLSGNESLGAT